MQDDGHFLLVDDIGGCRHVGLGVAVVDRGIHTLDGTGQHPQHLVLVVEVGNHIGTVDSGEGLIVGILQERRRTDGNGRSRRVEEGEEVGHQRVGQLCPEEVFQDFLIAGIAQCNLIEIVRLHELVEDVRTEHDGLRDTDLGVIETGELRMHLHDVVKESQATSLASQRAVADAGEVGIAVVLVTVEDSHHADVLHVTVLHDGIEDDLPVDIHILKLVPSDVLEIFRHGEDGPGAQPAAHVVARDVAQHRLAGYLEDVVLQLLEVAHPHDFLVGLGVAEDEVAEAHVVLHDLAEVTGHGLGVLVDKAETLGFSLLPVLALRTLEDERQVFVAATDLAQELQSGLRILVGRLHVCRNDIPDGETRVGNDSQRIVVVLII